MNYLWANIEGRVHRMEYNNTLGDAAALDPWFKRVFGDARATNDAFQRTATAAAKATASSSEPSQQPVRQEASGSATQESIFQSNFYEQVAGAVSTVDTVVPQQMLSWVWLPGGALAFKSLRLYEMVGKSNCHVPQDHQAHGGKAFALWQCQFCRREFSFK